MFDQVTAVKIKEKSGSSKLSYLIKISITALILYVLLSSIDGEQLIASFRQADFILVCASVLLGLLNIYTQYIKWKLICVSSLNESDSRTILNSLLYGFAGAVVTPFRLGEYAGRALAFRGNDNVRVTIATLADKFFSLLVIIITGISAVAVYLFIFEYIDTRTFWILLCAILLLVFFVKWFLSKGGMLKLRLLSLLRNYRVISGIVQRAEAFGGINSKMRIILVLLSAASFLCYTSQYSLLVCALSHQWQPQLFLLAGILTIFTKTIIPPVTFGELGIREGASVFFITQMGLPAAVGFNASILIFFFNIALPAATGAVLMMKRK